MTIEICSSCGEERECSWGPDPFIEELFGDDTPVWLCFDCWGDPSNGGEDE